MAKIKTGILGLVVLSILGIGVIGPSSIRFRLEQAKSSIIGSQTGFETTGGAWYRFIPDRYAYVPGQENNSPLSDKELAVSFSKAVCYYLLVPFPKDLASPNKMPSDPTPKLRWQIS